MENTNKYQSLLVIVLGLSLLSLLFKLKLLLYIGLGIGVVSMLIPRLGDGIVYLWFKLAQGLGWLNSRILLSIIFFVFLFPISLISRLFSKDSLQLKGDGDSTFTERNHQYEKKDLENIW